MKRDLYLILVYITMTSMTILGTAPVVLAHSNGSPAGYTGSPGDGHNCTSCHGGTAVTVSGWVTSNIPPTGYVGGNSYTITITATGTGKKGFELSPQNVAGAQLGVLAAGSGSKLVGGTKYVTQSSAVASGSTGIWSFTWTAPAAGTGSVNLYAAIVVGEPNTKLEVVTVNENLILPLAVTATANPTTITPGNSSQLNAAASGGSGTYTYSWTSVPAGFTSTQQNPVVSPTVTTQYFVTVNDGAGTAQGNVTVTVNIPAPLNVVAFANPSIINQGQTSQLNANASGGTGSYAYSWTSEPAGFTSTSQNPVVQPGVTTKYIVNVNDGSQSKKDSATVTVNALPFSASASATPSLICLGQTSQLNATPAGGSGSYTYSWTSVPAGFTSTLQNPVVTPTVTTQYTAHVSDGVNSVDASAGVTVNQPATAAAGTDTTCNNSTTQVPLHGTAANYASVLWTTSGTGTFSAATSLNGYYFPSTADKAAGNIVTLTLTANAQAPCTSPATAVRHIHFDGTSAIGGPGSLAGLVISPNPSTGLFSITLGDQETGTASVTISGLHGETVLRHTWEINPPATEKIDLTGYPKGMYIVTIRTGTGSSVRKLVID